MSGFIDWLEKLNHQDTRVRAILRRSLAFDPGQYPAAYPYVERFLSTDESTWRRKVHYLVAGLWAQHWREGRNGPSLSLPRALALQDREQRKMMTKEERLRLSSTEKRFVALLDADDDQLPYRLRQIVSLLTERQLDFGQLATDLAQWDHPNKYIQNQWAQDYYRALDSIEDDTIQRQNEEEAI